MDAGNLAAKLLIAFGIVAVIIGVVLLFIPKFPAFRLPGDFHVTSGSTSFSFPIVTCILISIVLTVVINAVLLIVRK